MKYFFLIFFNLIKLIPLYFNRFINYIKVIISFFYIKNILNKKNKTYYLVYDFETTNPTFGEYIWFLVLAKYLSLKNKDIQIIVVNNVSKKSTFNLLNKKKIHEFKKELQKLTFFFLKKKFIEYSNFKKFKSDFKYKKENVLFSSLVFNKLQIYDFLFKLINLLLSKEKNSFLNKIKFTKEYVPISKRLKKIKSYVCWSIRKNDKWGNYSNTKEEILKIATYLKRQKKNYPIIILSDKKTCIWARKILKNFKKIFYSDKIANNFVECAIAIVHSKYYFQYKGGGIVFIAYLSNIPYKIIGIHPPLDTKFSNKKFLSWQNENQKRVHHYKEISLSKILKEKL